PERLITALSGPAVNLVPSVRAAGALAFTQLAPPLSPLAAPYQPRLYNWREARYVEKAPARPTPPPADRAKDGQPPAAATKIDTASATTQAPLAQLVPVAPVGLLTWQVVAAQLFWVNWFLLL